MAAPSSRRQDKPPPWVAWLDFRMRPLALLLLTAAAVVGVGRLAAWVLEVSRPKLEQTIIRHCTNVEAPPGSGTMGTALHNGDASKARELLPGMSVALFARLPVSANREGELMAYLAAEHAKKVVGIVAAAMSVWQRLTDRTPERSRRRYRQDFVPVYLPGVHDLPSRRACDIELPLDELAQSLALGRGFGSVRTSVLQASFEQLRSAEGKGLLTMEGRQLKALVERQLAGRSLRLPAPEHEWGTLG